MVKTLYPLARKALFQLDGERAHELTIHQLKLVGDLRLTGLVRNKVSAKPKEVMGLTFPNPVGLAAGLDKNGDCIDAFGAMGFGSIEIGTVTPRPQPGNPKPRLFRLPEDQALINRMGFNNKGVDYLCERVRKSRYQGILGINIGKNFDTPLENAADDYVHCLKKVYPLASYVTVNISSPNTKNLRELQHGDALADLLSRLDSTREILSARYNRRVPLAIKIAPDISIEDLANTAQIILDHNADAIIATNTTNARKNLKNKVLAQETGGLSGAPLADASTHIVTELRRLVGNSFPIIGVGGIVTGCEAATKVAAGADLVQMYTGFIYQGPQLISDAAAAIEAAAAPTGN